MYQEERLHQITKLLQEKKTLSKSEIMESLDVSRDTARRDIVKLVEQGAAIRTHGGIAVTELNSEILSYRKRACINLEVKKVLAEHMARYLQGIRVCFFDVSTTVATLCDSVPDSLDVYTHSIDNLERLSCKNCSVRMFGGKLNRKYRYCYGSDTLGQIEQIRFDVAVLGAGAIHRDGIYVGEQEDAAIKRKVAERSDAVYIIADDSKFQSLGHFRCLTFEGVDKIIINRRPPEDWVHHIEKSGTTLELTEGDMK